LATFSIHDEVVTAMLKIRYCISANRTIQVKLIPVKELVNSFSPGWQSADCQGQ
jgi:hypothetical protein